MPANSAKAWSTEDDERLKALLEKGTHPAVVAAKLRRTATAVIGRASKIGISLRLIKLGLKAKK